MRRSGLVSGSVVVVVALMAVFGAEAPAWSAVTLAPAQAATGTGTVSMVFDRPSTGVEGEAVPATITYSDSSYAGAAEVQWFNPVSGQWEHVTTATMTNGVAHTSIVGFVDGGNASQVDDLRVVVNGVTSPTVHSSIVAFTSTVTGNTNVSPGSSTTLTVTTNATYMNASADLIIWDRSSSSWVFVKKIPMSAGVGSFTVTPDRSSYYKVAFNDESSSYVMFYSDQINVDVYYSTLTTALHSSEPYANSDIMMHFTRGETVGADLHWGGFGDNATVTIQYQSGYQMFVGPIYSDTSHTQAMSDGFVAFSWVENKSTNYRFKIAWSDGSVDYSPPFYTTRWIQNTLSVNGTPTVFVAPDGPTIAVPQGQVVSLSSVATGYYNANGSSQLWSRDHGNYSSTLESTSSATGGVASFSVIPVSGRVYCVTYLDSYAAGENAYANSDTCVTFTTYVPTVTGVIATYVAAGSHATDLGSPTANQVAWSAGGVTGIYQVFQRGMVMSSATTGTFAVVNGPIRDLWGATGGSVGSLGWPTGDVATVAGGVQQAFQNGVVFAPTGRPAVVLSGAIGTYFAAGSNAAALGSPTAAQVAWSAGGVTGVYQVFQHGMVMSSATTGTFAVVNGPIRDLWGATGGSVGSLGWPTGDVATVAGGTQQAFQNGVVFAPTGQPAVVMPSGAIGTYFAAGSNAAALGSPTAAQVSWSAGGVTGVYQVFQHGMVMSSATTGTFAVLNGPIRDLWGAAGGSVGSYGWPTGDQQTVTGGVQQAFQHGVLTTVVSAGSGAIATYVATGSNAATLGSATAAQVSWSGGGVTGVYQVFQHGMVMSSATTGTFAVLNGPIRDLWGAAGGSVGSYGWPTGDQQTVTGGVQQAFQHGVLTTVVSAGSGAIATYVGTGSNATALGSPTAAQVSWSGGGVTGVYQVFQHGMVMSSATTGTFAVLNGPIRDLWGAAGGSVGSYGWPTGDQQTVTGGVQQAFQHGVLTTVVSAGSGAIATYVATGSNAATLGSATASQVSWSGGGVTGVYQVFQHGMVMSSATTGTFAVLNGPIRDLWGAADGSVGSYGWPTGDQQTVTGGVQQAFQHGVIVAH